LKETSCHRLLTTRTTLKPLIDEIQRKLASSDPKFVVSIEEVPPLLRYTPTLVLKKKRTLSRPTLPALVRHWMMSASISTLLAAQAFLRAFRRWFAPSFTGRPSVRRSANFKFLVQLMISSHSLVFSKSYGFTVMEGKSSFLVSARLGFDNKRHVYLGSTCERRQPQCGCPFSKNREAQ
jgi:hypothetical protein